MILSLRLRNFMCYRGEHEINLGPLAYAIVARREDDPTRSNWSGKSALLEAIDFALHGRLNKARRFNADGWITRGEKDGHVEIVLDDGTTIKRSRVRGSATKVSYQFPLDKGEGGAEAERSIARWMGLSEDDFRASCYFEQRSMAKLILADPAERLGIVSGWLGLVPIENAEERAGEVAGEHAKKVIELRMKRNTLERVIASHGEAFTPETLVEKLEEEIDEHESALPIFVKKLEALNEERARARSKQRAQSVLDEYKIICKRGREIADELGEDTAEEIETEYKKALDAVTNTASAYQAAEREVATKKKVALGLFDGRCPVAQIECPATKQINADRKPAQKALKGVEGERTALEAAYTKAKQYYNGVKIAKSKFDALTAEIESLRTRGRAMLQKVKEAEALIADKKMRDETAVEVDLEEVRTEAQQITSQIEYKKKTLEQVAKLRAEIEALDKLIDVEAKKAQLAAQAKKVFRITHRRVAEDALSQINAMANEGLTTSGIDLRVDVRWEREGTTAAKTCDECGAAFPASVKVKQCEQCGAPRGMNLVNRLEFVLSDRSGAADDLAGVSLQLAAGAWLLRARESQWSCALIDEPFGQLDVFHRRALARHLASTLAGRYGYRQALVIAHDTAVLDALPGRIEVIASTKGSKVKVIA